MPQKPAGEAGRPIAHVAAVGALAVALAVFLAALPIFGRFCRTRSMERSSDFECHLQLIEELAWGGPCPVYPLFHLAVEAVRDDLLGHDGVIASAALVLALALAVRAALTFVAVRPSEGRSPGAAIVCVMLLLAMPLFNWWNFPNIYLGQLTPNVWHNPTTIFAMPFVLLAFLLAERSLESTGAGLVSGAGLALALTTLAKPNYLLAFGPIYLAFLIERLFRQWRRGERSVIGGAGRLLLAFGPVVCLLAWQAYREFYRTHGGGAGGGGIMIAPFAVWRQYSPNIPVSILVGLAFPLVVAAYYPAAVGADRAACLSWLTLGVALAESSLLAERGGRYMHGNFAWGNVFSDQVLFVTSAAVLLRQPYDRRFRLCILILAVHALIGVFYLQRSWWHRAWMVYL